MSDLLPPPSTGVAAVEDRKGNVMDFTSVWRKWFIDLTKIINDSGGTDGAVPASRLISTTTPLSGGGDLTEDRTIAFSNQGANIVLAGPAVGPSSAAPTFRSLVPLDCPGITATVVLAKVTPTGNNGQLGFVGGVLTTYIPPT